MMHVQKTVGIVISLIIILNIGVPTESSIRSIVSCPIETFEPASVGNITSVPYVWQEINGFCHWAAFSMILQSAGIPLDLSGVFAATGIGFSASYLRLDTDMILLPGAFFPQMVSTFAISDLYGLNLTMYLDSSTSEAASLFADQLAFFDIEFTEISGFDEAFASLKKTIDSGYPFEIWTDPYYLPPWDYDIVRQLDTDVEESTVGHAIVAVGYNETSGIVSVLDPGVGAFGDVGYPADGRYYYDLNLTQLDNAWKPLFYGGFAAKPDDGPPSDFSSRLANHIIQLICGNRSLYLSSMEDAYFWLLGSDAFRGLAYDLTATSLSTYIDEFGSLTRSEKAQILGNLGLMTEGFLAIQYLSFRAALKALPGLLPELELDDFVAAGTDALQHFETLSANASMVTVGYEGGATITTETLNSIAYDCQYTYTGDVEAAVTENEHNLETIRNHLLAIADSWDTAANALYSALNGDSTATFVSVIVVTSGFVCVFSFIAYRRRKTRSHLRE